MNLFLNPSEREFRQLIIKAEKNNKLHDVVVDFDGEVLIDPQLEQPNLDLDKFKIHIRLSNHIKEVLDQKRLKDLFNNILSNWNEMYESILLPVFIINQNEFNNWEGKTSRLGYEINKIK